MSRYYNDADELSRDVRALRLSLEAALGHLHDLSPDDRPELAKSLREVCVPRGMLRVALTCADTTRMLAESALCGVAQERAKFEAWAGKPREGGE